MGKPVSYEYSNKQEILVYFDYQDGDLPFLKALQDKLGAKKYNGEDFSSSSSPLIVFHFLNVITRIDHYLKESSKQASQKAGGNLVYVRLHITGSGTYSDDSFDPLLISGYNRNHVVLKGQYNTQMDNNGITFTTKKELMDEASLEAQIRNIVSSMK